MNDVPFSAPLILQLKATGPRRVSTCLEAMKCLENEWPNWARGRNWRRAMLACREALNGRLDAKKARQRLLKAAQRAGILATPRRNDASYHAQQVISVSVAH